MKLGRFWIIRHDILLQNAINFTIKDEFGIIPFIIRKFTRSVKIVSLVTINPKSSTLPSREKPVKQSMFFTISFTMWDLFRSEGTRSKCVIKVLLYLKILKTRRKQCVG